MGLGRAEQSQAVHGMPRPSREGLCRGAQSASEFDSEILPRLGIAPYGKAWIGRARIGSAGTLRRALGFNERDSAMASYGDAGLGKVRIGVEGPRVARQGLGA